MMMNDPVRLAPGFLMTEQKSVAFCSFDEAFKIPRHQPLERQSHLGPQTMLQILLAPSWHL